jgi:hypothetical protein
MHLAGPPKKMYRDVQSFHLLAFRSRSSALLNPWFPVIVAAQLPSLRVHSSYLPMIFLISSSKLEIFLPKSGEISWEPTRHNFCPSDWRLFGLALWPSGRHDHQAVDSGKNWDTLHRSLWQQKQYSLAQFCHICCVQWHIYICDQFYGIIWA